MFLKTFFLSFKYIYEYYLIDLEKKENLFKKLFPNKIVKAGIDGVELILPANVMTLEPYFMV